jgi:glycosyltransferase involved in cell wall biosynthesis
MPVHAGADWLAETLESVAREPSEGIELLILDSTPDDSCEEIVSRYANRLSIRYHPTPDILAWPAKMNAAAQLARGKHLAMLHQDDLWLPGRVAAVRRAIDAWPDAALFLNPSQIIDGGGRAMGVWQCPLPTNVALGTSEVAERLLIQNFISMPASIIRTEAWIRVGGMDDALWYTADWDLYLKIAGAGDTIYSPDVTTAFRIHPRSLTVKGSRDSAGFLEQMERVIDRHIELVPAAGRQRTLKTARVSAAINTSLAATMHGRRIAILKAGLALLSLSPAEIVRYARNSRLHERVLPRLRAKLAGNF